MQKDGSAPFIQVLTACGRTFLWTQHRTLTCHQATCVADHMEHHHQMCSLTSSDYQHKTPAMDHALYMTMLLFPGVRSLLVFTVQMELCVLGGYQATCQPSCSCKATRAPQPQASCCELLATFLCATAAVVSIPLSQSFELFHLNFWPRWASREAVDDTATHMLHTNCGLLLCLLCCPCCLWPVAHI